MRNGARGLDASNQINTSDDNNNICTKEPNKLVDDEKVTCHQIGHFAKEIKDIVDSAKKEESHSKSKYDSSSSLELDSNSKRIMLAIDKMNKIKNKKNNSLLGAKALLKHDKIENLLDLSIKCLSIIDSVETRYLFGGFKVKSFLGR